MENNQVSAFQLMKKYDNWIEVINRPFLPEEISEDATIVASEHGRSVKASYGEFSLYYSIDRESELDSLETNSKVDMTKYNFVVIQKGDKQIFKIK